MQINWLSIAVVIISVCLLQRCEAGIGDNGTVLDEQTNSPIDRVLVILSVKNKPLDSTYTNSSGQYRLFSLVGAVFGIPDYEITHKKHGYRTGATRYDGKVITLGTTIFLKKVP